ncbi:MAG: ATP-dependent sacrificial sulfur transferase LarE [Actinobacteria bacterium]|nr:ATP-dependent sacrificial sulfur transferase LarE [Actinomycetota bacterium]MBU4386179.1 ATP-dependent sacrificial sulfur transferase LarE [Actinomycetota bacterium]MBU4490537.1 ATP-dependent sacrificial sulfur transferase LarE [Actinomycetota bacterium]
MEANLKAKHLALKRNLADTGSAVLAFSGGVDSTLVLAVGREALGDRIIAATARSPLYPRSVVERAATLAQRLCVEHVVLDSNELEDARFTSNPPERCYLCKRELYGRLDRLAKKRGVAAVIDGTQLDDTSDYRPGMRAAAEFGVRSPLLEVGFTKDEIRAFSKELGLDTWDIPAGPCLASRVPYSEEITPRKLAAIEQGEQFLGELGFREVRVRFTKDSTARIEITADCISKLADKAVREKVVGKMKELGFLYVTLDLEGYRTGSMNMILADQD